MAVYAAATIAIIGTAVIEVGLRVLAPHTVDAILYRRFQGLHLAMSIAIWIMTVVLLAASGVLSFNNSREIVAQVTPEAEQQGTAAVDSLHATAITQQKATWSSDSAAIAQRYVAQVEAQGAAFDGQISAAKRELSNLYNRERRSGQSFASAKDVARQKIADLEATKASTIAGLESSKAEELATARRSYRSAVELAGQRHTAAQDSILAINQAARDERSSTVSTYGYGLAYFTLIALLVFCASVILDRIHRKGSGIEETVELSQYDVNPPAFVEAWAALRDRWQYAIRSRISAFADKTPAAPLPASPSELYDPAQLANISVTLKIEREPEEQEGENVIYIRPKRRQIGFKPESTTSEEEDSPRDLYSTPTTHETPDLRHYKQRLKFYKKRLGSHTQKKLKLERSGKEVPTRTLNAIENNKQWVEHYEQLINEALTGK